MGSQSEENEEVNRVTNSRAVDQKEESYNNQVKRVQWTHTGIFTTNSEKFEKQFSFILASVELLNLISIIQYCHSVYVVFILEKNTDLGAMKMDIN